MILRHERGKTRRSVDDALNGDRDSIDAAVRRALYAVSTEMDEHSQAMNVAHAEILETVEVSVKRLEKQLSKVQALLATTAITFLIALATGLLNAVLR